MQNLLKSNNSQLLGVYKLLIGKQAVLILLSIILAVSLLARTAHATDSTAVPEFISKFGVGLANGSSTEPGKLSQPTDVAVDSVGNVYVADSRNARIQKFSNDGAYITSFGSLGSGNGQMNYPWDVAVDANDNVFVADDNNHRIQKFSSTGTYITQWGSYGSGNGQFWSPEAVIVDQAGNVYVGDVGNGRIQKFSNDGTYITQWGSFGSGNGQFSYISGLDVDGSGNVYVTDENQSRVQVFSNTGTFLAKWGTNGVGNGQLDGPTGIAIDKDDNVYVVDSYNCRIQKFTKTGTYLSQWGNEGSADGQFSYQSGMDVDGSGDVFVADTYNHRIQKFGYPKIVEFEVPNSNQDIQLTTPAATSITSSAVVTEASLAQQDSANTFPLGLVDFELSAAAGSTQQINLAFVTDLSPRDVTARKYHSVNNTYGDVPGATITETTLGGKHALNLSYSITDGGALDDDSLPNGVIIDPVGLAVANVAAVATPGAPSSGNGMTLTLPLAAAFVAFPILMYVVVQRRSKS